MSFFLKFKEENNAEIEEDVAVVKISSNNFQNESNAFEKFVEAHADKISTIATLPSEKSINDISAEHKQVMKSENTEFDEIENGQWSYFLRKNKIRTMNHK